MNYRIIRHPEVAADVMGIVDLLLYYADPDVAERKIEQIEETIQALSELPHIGSLRDDIHPGIRAIPTAGKGVIAFRVDDAQKIVYIISITYADADWMYRLRARIH